MDINKFTDDFVTEWNGHIINVNGANINYDGRYGIQCMDLWNYWWSELGCKGIQPHADAASVWEDTGGKHYTFFDGILPSRPAKKGDIFIYNRSAWGTGYGHIGLVLSDNGDTITVLETNGLGDGREDSAGNQYGTPARIHTWPKTNLYGYLRFIGEDVAITHDDIVAIGDEILNRPITRLGGQKGVTSLRSVVAYYDANLAMTIHSTIAGVMAANPKATAADISAAVQSAIKGSQITFTAP